MKLAYKGGIRDLTDLEALKRVEYKWQLYKAKERGRIHRIKEDEWEPVSISDRINLLNIPLRLDPLIYAPALFFKTLFPS